MVIVIADIIQGERIDDLQYKGLKIIQNPSVFCFGTDAVLLAGFTKTDMGSRAIDLCTGSGVIPMLVSARCGCHFDAVEIQENIADMAARSVAMNTMDGKISIIHGDIRNIELYCKKNSYHTVTCNPPYKKINSGKINESEYKAIARHELMCTIEDVVSAAWKLLVAGGKLFLIHRTDRFTELLHALEKGGLEPKRIRMIQPSAQKAPNLFMLEAVKQGKPGVQWEPALFVYDSEGNYTKEMKEIYHMEETLL